MVRRVKELRLVVGTICIWGKEDLFVIEISRHIDLVIRKHLFKNYLPLLVSELPAFLGCLLFCLGLSVRAVVLAFLLACVPAQDRHEVLVDVAAVVQLHLFDPRLLNLVEFLSLSRKHLVSPFFVDSLENAEQEFLVLLELAEFVDFLINFTGKRLNFGLLGLDLVFERLSFGKSFLSLLGGLGGALVIFLDELDQLVVVFFELLR